MHRPIDLQKSIDATKAKIETYKRLALVAVAIDLTLRAHDGKQLTKRIEKAVMDNFHCEDPTQTLSVHFMKETGMDWYKLNVWGAGIGYDSRISIILGRFGSRASNQQDEGKPFSYTRFKEREVIPDYRKAKAELEEALVDASWQVKTYNGALLAMEHANNNLLLVRVTS